MNRENSEQIEVFIDSVNKTMKFDAPIITTEIKEELLRQYSNSKDFVFFSDDGNQYYSTNDQINSKKCYALSLTQAIRYITKVTEGEEQIYNLETDQISELPKQHQTLEDQRSTKELKSNEKSMQQREIQHYEMEFKINNLEDQIEYLNKELNWKSQQLNETTIELNTVMKSYQSLKYQQKEQIQQLNHQISLRDGDLQRLEIDKSNKTLENENLQQRIRNFEIQYQLIATEVLTLKQQQNIISLPQDERIRQLTQKNENLTIQLGQIQQNYTNLKNQHEKYASNIKSEMDIKYQQKIKTLQGNLEDAQKVVQQKNEIIQNQQNETLQQNNLQKLTRTQTTIQLPFIQNDPFQQNNQLQSSRSNGIRLRPIQQSQSRQRIEQMTQSNSNQQILQILSEETKNSLKRRNEVLNKKQNI